MTTTAIQTKTDPGQSLAAMLQSASTELRKIAPKYCNVTRMISLAIEAKQRNPLLANCSPISVVNFCKKCAEAGTDRIGAGGMWAVPFRNNDTKTYDMTAIPDWRLLIQKAKAAKVIKHATAEAVYAADEFDYERGLNPSMTHKPARRDRGELVAVYCVYVLPDDTKDFVVMDMAADIDPIRKRSKAANFGPWVTDPAEMAKKTVVRRAMKIFEGASPEMTKVIDLDNIGMGYLGEVDTTAARTPIAEPKAIEVASETTPPPAEQPQDVTRPHQGGAAEDKPDAGQPHAQPEGILTVTGILDMAMVKKGKNSGKPYYSIQIGGEWHNTFDKAIYDHAEVLKGREVIGTYTASGDQGQFKNLVTLAEVASE